MQTSICRGFSTQRLWDVMPGRFYLTCEAPPILNLQSSGHFANLRFDACDAGVVGAAFSAIADDGAAMEVRMEDLASLPRRGMQSTDTNDF